MATTRRQFVINAAVAAALTQKSLAFAPPQPEKLPPQDKPTPLAQLPTEERALIVKHYPSSKT